MVSVVRAKYIVPKEFPYLDRNGAPAPYRVRQGRPCAIQVFAARTDGSVRLYAATSWRGSLADTEVLDAEGRRVRSLTDFSKAPYDEALGLFRLRRDIGEL